VPELTGIGEATCAMADDAYAIYWNPAGLALLKDKELGAMYNIWFEDIRHGFLGYTHPFNKFTFGGAINYLDAEKMEKTTFFY
jgi:long-subunit fatty acid transport protein